MKHHCHFILLIGALLVMTSLSAQQSEARKYSNEFLNIGVGARAFGMGNAQTAVATDVTASYWNPAGLAAKQAHLNPEVSLMHAAYFASLAAYNYAGFTMPIDSAGLRRFGLSLVRIGVDGLPNTLNLIESDGSINLDRLQSFSVSDFAAIFSYAWRLRKAPQWSFGANAKIIYRGVGRFANAWGFGLDAGVHYTKNKLRLGFVLKDFTNTFTGWTFNTETFEKEFINTGQEIPQNRIELTRPSLRTGVAYDLTLGRRIGLLAALDMDVFFDGQRVSGLANLGDVNLDPHLGLEFSYTNDLGQKVAFIRGGLYNLQYLELDHTGEKISDVFPTLGAGFVVGNFRVDYALANVDDAGQNGTQLHTHVVSVNIFIK